MTTSMNSCFISVILLLQLLVVCNNIPSSQAFCPTTTSTSITTTTRSSTFPFQLHLTPEPLAEEGSWTAYLDDTTTGLVYYFNAGTGESLWTPPTETFPSISLNEDQQVIATNLQKKYSNDKQQQQKKSSQKKTTATTKTTEKKKKETKKEEGSSLIGTLFSKVNENRVVDKKPATTKKAEPTTKKVVTDTDDSSLFGNLFAKKEEAATTTAAAEPKVAKKETTTKDEAISFGGFPKLGNLFQKSSDESSSTSTTLELDMSAYVLPHPAKVRWGGEDAVFCKGRTFGVFDGVSGAEKLDGVPLYSVTLAQEMKQLVPSDMPLSVQQLTQQLTTAAEFADRSATGASTAVVASLSPEGELQALNVGDSSCFVIRNNAIMSKTKEIVHYFDCPYQLSEDSPDRPKDGTKLKVKCQPGDVIVMGSDGVFDNLSDAALLEQVSQYQTQRAAVLARKVVEASRRVSLDETAETPYAKMAKRNGDEDYVDGVG
eukprot:CAMPEP_0194213144 /NCGR_PEP_ID=MMETSP0156-20130528/13543_1 /TAXON_ID=33649 /ORGANISM="Thalassionema nitzschioides, Strain L26-B" /LENGTH=486 /DNA_ID=CAMNT_0038941113 /DNA_START=58 /DNA_END=1514 /DNA_ORIENTATION=-